MVVEGFKTTSNIYLNLNVDKSQTNHPPSVTIVPSYNPYILYERQQNIVFSCVIDANPSSNITYNWHYPDGSMSGKFLTIPTVIRDEPVISVIHGNNITEGQTLYISPIIDSYPSPTYIWWTRQNDDSFLHIGTPLQIYNIQTKDSDNYTCIVMNTLTPSGLPSQNRTSHRVFKVYVQLLSANKAVKTNTIGIWFGSSLVALMAIAITGLCVYKYRKRQVPNVEDVENQKKKIDESFNTYEDIWDVRSKRPDHVYQNMKISDKEYVLTTTPERATVGQDFNFTCHITSNKDSYVFITRDSIYESLISNDYTCKSHLRSTDFNSTCYNHSIILTIPGTYDIDILHESSWKCGGLFRGSISNTVSLYVYVPITNIGLTATPYDTSPVEILNGSSQHFTCTTNPGRPPSKIQWYLSDANITYAATAQPDVCDPGCYEKVRSSSVLLYIGNSNDNGKTIYCTAENVEEQSVRSLDRRIDILYPPVIFNIPDYNITEGSTLYITPSIEANPQPISVWWTRQNDSSFIYNGMNITIINIQKDYDDYYKCNAMNTITTPNHPTQNKTTEELFKVNVLSEANPVDAIMYQWKYPAGTIRNGVLTITTVSKRHNGQYSCSATNSVGTSIRTGKQIDVQYAPVISGIQEYNVDAGRALNVIPTVDAHPSHTSIWWTRQHSVQFIYYGWNLTFINIQESDSDNYTCHVMNTLIPSGLSAQNRTSITVFNINVQKIPNDDAVNSAAIGVGTGLAVIMLILGAASLFVFLYRKRRMKKRKENRNSKVYESELDKPRQTSGVDNHLYNELQDLKSEKQIRQKDTNLYVNLELKPATRT
ncbi:Hypothetical predicted protein [Mytilus galloprovincialis]|uniref:Ig-like domain-containing protein n=1 Tax=Mytilus galloprovincialis TaxID=29158 RepID=A0A8B6GWI7_MYTGA|nr:Hypothetical predicted protein [Mytilus galloprovincialis]